MLKRGFYDFLTLIFAILLIISVYFQIHTFSENQNKAFDCYLEGKYQGAELENCLNQNNVSNNTQIFRGISYGLMGIYWLFIFVLALKLHKRNFTKTIDAVVISILVPLAIIFYLTNLRGSLKKYQKSKR